jgi:alkanesulfonate monooxygenase SsuD/methylene tetrahydromethanopterin reductase-like flavin-dependent oxidoreductase (luciferase family)
MEAPLEDRVIVGTRREVIAGLSRYREELAMDLLIVRPLVAGVSAEERMASMVEIVEEVGPALR